MTTVPPSPPGKRTVEPAGASERLLVLEPRFDRPGRHPPAPVWRQFHPVLFGGEQAGAQGLGPRRQEAQQARVVAGVIGKRGEVGQLAAGGPQRPLHLPRLADTGEGQLRARRRRAGRDQAGDQHRLGTEQGDQRWVGRVEIGRQQQHHGVGAREAGRQRLAHRAGGEHGPVAERPLAAPRFAVDHDQGQRLPDRRVLVAVVHDDHCSATRRRGPSASGALARHPHRRVGRHHQRFVADVGCALQVGVDQQRSLQPAAVATREDLRHALRAA